MIYKSRPLSEVRAYNAAGAIFNCYFLRDKSFLASSHDSPSCFLYAALLSAHDGYRFLSKWTLEGFQGLVTALTRRFSSPEGKGGFAMSWWRWDCGEVEQGQSDEIVMKNDAQRGRALELLSGLLHT